MSFRALLACLILAPALLGQGSGRLTLEAVAHPTKKVAYAGRPATRLDWLPDGALVETRREGDQVALYRIDPATWERKPLLESARLQAALVAAGAGESAAKGSPGPWGLHLERSPQRLPADRGRGALPGGCEGGRCQATRGRKA